MAAPEAAYCEHASYGDSFVNLPCANAICHVNLAHALDRKYTNSPVGHPKKPHQLISMLPAAINKIILGYITGCVLR